MINKIIFDKVSLNFGTFTIFDNLSIEFRAGQITGIIGANGAGKSTLLKLAGQFIQPDSGLVTAFDDDKVINRIEFRQKIAAITPNMNLYSQLTALENLNFFTKMRDKRLMDNEIDKLFNRVNLDIENKNKIVGNFSTGMKQRLKLAILLAVDSEVWILDEPGSNLDEYGKHLVLNEMKNAAQSGKLVLLATNDNDEAEAANELISLPIN